MQPATRSDFEVAIICTLPLMAEPIHNLLDEYNDEENNPYGKQTGDPNIYTTGRMGRHHVVLVYMSNMGKVSAASVATSLSISFNCIKLALIVGTCGAVPFPHEGSEIILGDVIISKAVVEYDYGRQYSDKFERKTDVTDILGRPNQEIRSVLSKLETHRYGEQLRRKISQYLAHLQKQPRAKATYPGVIKDRLFKASYRHMHHQRGSVPHCVCDESTSNSSSVCEETIDADCESLECEGYLVQRRRLQSSMPEPLAHIGMIASGSTVMESARHRDTIAKAESVIAFEMEGAGAWDSLPCVIIKGVSDYADGHKSDGWRNYAAATAVSAAKAFLDFWISTGHATDESVIKKSE